MKELLDEIEGCDEIDQNIIWSLLKRKDEQFGIRKKLECMCRVFGLNDTETQGVIDGAEKEGERILDKANRMAIHEALMKAAKKN